MTSYESKWIIKEKKNFKRREQNRGFVSVETGTNMICTKINAWEFLTKLFFFINSFNSSKIQSDLDIKLPTYKVTFRKSRLAERKFCVIIYGQVLKIVACKITFVWFLFLFNSKISAISQCETITNNRFYVVQERWKR